MLLPAALLLLAAPPGHGSGALHVAHGQVVDAAGKPFRFMGLNVPSLEWTATGEHVLQSIAVAGDTWHANAIRLPMSQDRWFGKAPDSTGAGASYRALVDAAVAAASKRRMYILLDLHWSDCGDWGQNIGQHDLPDLHSLEFWKAVARRFANRPYVLFDLYNEPIEAPLAVWRNGGAITETVAGKPKTYQAVGLQQLFDAVRAQGAKNLVVAGGLGYASRLDFYPKFLLKDPGGNGVLYAEHYYPGWEPIEAWQKRMDGVLGKFPIVVSEFGASRETLPLDDPKRRLAQELRFIDARRLGFIAWCMHPAAEPCVISDWNYTPTPYFGALIKARLAGRSVPVPPRGANLGEGIVYRGKLGPGWQSWSNAAVDFASNADGRSCMKVDLAQGQQMQLGVVPFDGFNFRAISLWLDGGPEGGQRLELLASVMDQGQMHVALPVLKPNAWTHVEVPFSALGIAGRDNVKSFALFAAGHAPAPTFYVADVTLPANR